MDESGTKYCRECGEAMRFDDLYCPTCGSKQVTDSGVDSHPDAIMEPPEIVKKTVLVVATLAVLFLAAISLMTLASIGSQSTGESPTESETTEQPDPEPTVRKYWAAMDDGDRDRANTYTTTKFQYDSADQVDFATDNTTINHLNVELESQRRATIVARVKISKTPDAYIIIRVTHELQYDSGKWLITDTEDRLILDYIY